MSQLSSLPTSPTEPHPIRLLDRDDHGIWRARDATVRDIRDRVTVAARRAVCQAVSRGLKVEIFAASHTEITGGFGNHKLVISHRQQDGQPRITRFRLARLDGTVLNTIDAARAAGWIAIQPRIDRCRAVTPCAVPDDERTGTGRRRERRCRAAGREPHQSPSAPRLSIVC